MAAQRPKHALVWDETGSRLLQESGISQQASHRMKRSGGGNLNVDERLQLK